MELLPGRYPVSKERRSTCSCRFVVKLTAATLGLSSSVFKCLCLALTQDGVVIGRNRFAKELTGLQLIVVLNAGILVISPENSVEELLSNC